MAEYDLTPEELNRYSRHLLLPEISAVGQKKLKKARVLVVGAGGLGCPALLYLAAAGTGHIGIVDFDVVEISNLQRQILFKTDDAGQPKAKVAARRLRELNPLISIRPYHTKLTSENALEILQYYDVVIDGTDNFPVRYLLNDACVILGKTLIYGAIFRFEGQVSVFNYTNADGSRGPNYRDLFPTPPPPEAVPNCAEAGVLGVLPGIIGGLQANEAIKIICDTGEPLSGKLFILDTLSMVSRLMKFAKNPATPAISELIDYDEFCQTSKEHHPSAREITALELKSLLSGNTLPVIIDVREPQEYLLSNLGGKNIPLAEIVPRMAEIPATGDVILICRSGRRSAQAQAQLLDFGYKNTTNLQGGLLGWRAVIDRDFIV